MRPRTLIEYDATLVGTDGLRYRARACGRERADGLWEGWIEFEAPGADELWRTSRETTQPNLADLVYWATGVSAVYLEGALARAMDPPLRITAPSPAPPAFDGPADDVQTALPVSGLRDVDEGDPVLNPFTVYATRGEAPLRRQLGALAAWHLRTIARAHRVLPAAHVEHMDKLALVEAIVAAARVLTIERSPESTPLSG